MTFLSPSKLESGLHQGMVKLNGGADGLAFDDVRYFSFTTQPSMKVLIVADKVTDEDLDALFVKAALSPDDAIGAFPLQGGTRHAKTVPGARPPLSEGLRGGFRPECRRTVGERLGPAFVVCQRWGEG